MNVLLVVAHPDDEILGAGAAIQQIKKVGGKVTAFALSNSSPTRENELREKMAASDEIIGIDKSECEYYETMKFGQYSRYQMVRAIEKRIIESEPDIIFTHFPGDLHRDHQITAELVAEAARLPQRGTGYSKPITAIFQMEILSSTDWNYKNEFSPNAYFPATKDQIKEKAKALLIYDGVLRPDPHPRTEESLLALARYRGGQCGASYAEAFHCSYLNMGGLQK